MEKTKQVKVRETRRTVLGIASEPKTISVRNCLVPVELTAYTQNNPKLVETSLLAVPLP